MRSWIVTLLTTLIFLLASPVIAVVELDANSDGKIDSGFVGWPTDVTTGEPTTEAIGDLFIADNDTWDPATYTSVSPGAANDYLVICTATGSPGTYEILMDMLTGERFFSSFMLQNGTDPDLTAESQISNDTDGANETDDVVLRGRDGSSNQFAYSRKLKCFNATIPTPNDYADATRDKFFIWSNETGMIYTITKIEAWADVDDTAFNVEKYDADGASNNTTVDAINCTTGSGPYTATETAITGPTIAAGHTVFLDFDDTDDPGWVKVTICGWLNSNVD